MATTQVSTPPLSTDALDLPAVPIERVHLVGNDSSDENKKDVVNDNDDNNYDDDDDECSVDAQNALLEMLGLPTVTTRTTTMPLSSVLVMDEEEEEEEEEEISADNPSICCSTTTTTKITVPPKCSRYGYVPSECAAVVVNNFWSAQDCQALIELARRQEVGFQYITEATHTAPDGSKYTVQLSNPNPHKLAVFENATIIDRIWNQLLVLQDNNLLQSDWLLQYQQRCCRCRRRTPSTSSSSSSLLQIRPVGLNPRIRVLEYNANANDRFEPHFDATTHVGPDYTSHITVLLYLNNGNGVDFDGGETLYLNCDISNYNNNNNTNNNTNTNKKSNNNHHDEDNQDVVKIIPQTGTLVMFEHDLYHAGAPLVWGTKYVMRTDILFETMEVEQPNSSSSSSSSSSKSDDTEIYIIQDPESINSNDDNNNSNNNNNNGMTQKPLLSVIDLCQKLEWTMAEQAILDELGLLECTLESFLVPGTRLLQAMLVEGGMDDTNRVQELIQTAIVEQQRQKNHL